jgi:hypothetical protein
MKTCPICNSQDITHNSVCDICDKCGCREEDIEILLGCDGGGYYAEWFYEDDQGRFYAARWYGPKNECEAKVNEPIPPMHLEDEHGDGPPYDAATASGAYD